MSFTIDINVNVPGLTAILQPLKDTIMSAISDALKASNDSILAKLTEFEGKVDAFTLVASTTKDALVALQATVANGQVATAADLQAIIDAQTAAIAGIDAAGAKVDAAAVADAP